MSQAPESLTRSAAKTRRRMCIVPSLSIALRVPPGRRTRLRPVSDSRTKGEGRRTNVPMGIPHRLVQTDYRRWHQRKDRYTRTRVESDADKPTLERLATRWYCGSPDADAAERAGQATSAKIPQLDTSVIGSPENDTPQERADQTLRLRNDCS